MKGKAPHQGGEASRNSCGGISCETLTLSTLRVQHLMARYALPVETAVIVSALMFEGMAHG